MIYQRLRLRPGRKQLLMGPWYHGALTAQWTAGTADLGPECTENHAFVERGGATFTSPPVRKRTQIAGPLALHLRGSSSRSDGYWVAELTDVAPDGTSTQITAGSLLMSRRALDDERSVRAPNGDLAIPVDLPRLVGAVQTVHISRAEPRYLDAPFVTR